MPSSRISTLLVSLYMMLAAVASAQPSTRFAQLENELLNAKELSLVFHVAAAGAIQVDIEGSLGRTTTGDISLQARGVFAGQDVDLVAIKTAQSFEYGRRNAPVVTVPPEGLWEALIFGFTRMGILHNIANLSADAMPDHAEGGVTDWVLASNIEKDETAFTFDIIVSDTPSGSARLVFDELGNPSLRQQTVAFPGGEMRVVETYSNVSISE